MATKLRMPRPKPKQPTNRRDHRPQTAMRNVCRQPAHINKTYTAFPPVALLRSVPLNQNRPTQYGTAQWSGLYNKRLFNNEAWGELVLTPTPVLLRPQRLSERVGSPTLVYEFVQPYEISQCCQVQHAEVDR